MVFNKNAEKVKALVYFAWVFKMTPENAKADGYTGCRHALILGPRIRGCVGHDWPLGG